MANSASRTTIAIAWCLGWETLDDDSSRIQLLTQMREALNESSTDTIPTPLHLLVQQAQTLERIAHHDFPETIEALQTQYSNLLEQKTPIGLVYGGATKIKQYVFEAAKLQDIRGASALLDQINLADLPAFFQDDSFQDDPSLDADQRYRARQHFESVREWLQSNYPELTDALIPELIIYSTGGNILAFCPASLIEPLTNAIEQRYTEETLTANSCAVGHAFRLLEFQLGLLADPIEETRWLDWYLQNYRNVLVQGSFNTPATSEKAREAFQQRKSFNELVGKLTTKFNARRSGNLDSGDRPSRRYPPMFETQPYFRRDGSDRRLATTKAQHLPNEPWFSDVLARKRRIGQITKREDTNASWFRPFEASVGTQPEWKPSELAESWVRKFESFLELSPLKHEYYDGVRGQAADVAEARSLAEIGQSSQGFVAYIYADGNNMGGYIQNKIQTPGAYRRFSRDIFNATQYCVYLALEQHLRPVWVEGKANTQGDRQKSEYVHPFEIVTIGGDDVFLIVPANKALEIAKTLSEEFENILLKSTPLPSNVAPVKGNYERSSDRIPADPQRSHRYEAGVPSPSRCQLSMSAGVLITSYKTPIYYAEKLTSQLMKSAKKYAKTLKKTEKGSYQGGTIDFLVMKAVTALTSSIEDFRKQALTEELHHRNGNKQTLQLYAAPYTLHELGGLLDTVRVLKNSQMGRSQIYKIRSLLEQGKRTAILNYRYFRVRLDQSAQAELQQTFENAWCSAHTNKGNLAPWMPLGEGTYETLWRELVDLYPFVSTAAEAGRKLGAARDRNDPVPPEVSPKVSPEVSQEAQS